MKRLLLFSLAASCVFTSFAQSNKEDVDLVQAIYGKEKKEIVESFITPPNDAKKKSFWSLYDAYETQRKSFGKKRIALLEKYANSYGTASNGATDGIMKQTMTLQKSLDGLIATYYEKIKAAVGVTQASQFYQLESYLLSATRVYILGNIPFINELEKNPATPQ